MLTNEDILMISDLLDTKLDAQSKIIDEKNQQSKDELCGEMRRMKFELRGEVQELRGEFHGEMHGLGSELRGEMQELRGELRGEMQEIGSELHGEMQELKNELHDEMQEIGSELRGEMQSLKNELCGEMQNLRNELHEEIKFVKREITDLKNGLQKLGDEVDSIKIMLESDIIPRLCTIESCYVDTYRRYSMGVVEIEKVRTDVDILKNVVKEHSEKLNKAQ